MRAAMRCTAPMNAPGPPPTMPSRIRRCFPCILDSPGMFAFLSRCEAQHPPIRFLICPGFCKIVKRALSRLDNVPRNKRRTFPRSLIAALHATLPFEHRPSVEIVLRQLRKNPAKIHLPVAQRAKTPRASNPRLVSPVNALAPRRMKLRVLHVKHFHAGMIDVEKRQVIELLQNKMAGIEQNVASFVPTHAVEEHVERHTIVKVLARMQFVTQIDSRRVKRIENRLPPFR